MLRRGPAADRMPTSSKLSPILITVVVGIALVGAMIVMLQPSASPPATATPASSPTAAGSSAADSDAVAIVNGQAISRAEWQRVVALDRALSQLAGQPAPAAESTLERLINERLVLQQAGSEPYAIGLPDAESRLAALMQQWGSDDAALDLALSQAGTTRQDLLVTLQRLLVVEAHLNRIAQTRSPEDWLARLRAGAQVEFRADLAAVAQPTEAAAAPTAAPTPGPALPIGVQTGQQAPDFTLNGPDGVPVRLSDLRGRPIVLNFWATWCPPCRVEAPALQAAFERHESDGVVVLGIDQREDAAAVRQFASEFGLTYPLLLDGEGSVSELYQVLGIPTTVFLDARGVVAARHVGPLTEEQIAQYLGPLTGAAAATTPEVAPPGAAPDFALPRETGEIVRLSDYRDRSSVVVLFYRGST